MWTSAVPPQLARDVIPYATCLTDEEWAAVAPASLHDSHGGIGLLRASRETWPFLQRCFADSA